jgi:CCR4-NOT complex subunit CAF16
MYCGDWWRTNFFFNLLVSDLIGEDRLKSPRVQELIDIMEINLSWRINAISDGQRRRIQIIEALAEEKQFYVLDEITTDLDLYAREGLLKFLRKETEEKGATVFYATHIFDSLADWATHVMFFSKAKVAKCCSIGDLKEYHDLVSNGTRCPLYTLMKSWVIAEYAAPVPYEVLADAPMAPSPDGPTLEVTKLTFAYAQGLAPCLKDMSFSFNRGARILVVGANGACKSTVMSILGGKRMIPRGFAKILGKDCFNDTSISQQVMYCGDWWNTQFFMNTTIADLLVGHLDTDRCRHLASVLQVDVNWKINSISDGQRRRCQLLEMLLPYRSVYLMDEITSDLDIFAREGILAFLKGESEKRGCTIFYCTHIFDHLEGWASHMLHLSKGQVVRACAMDEIQEYSKLCAGGCLTPLYSLIREWMYAEYDADMGAKPWRKLEDTNDGRVPNLGLAGPFQTVCA